MKKIDSDIKSNTYSKIYLIFGEEGYLRRFYTSKLIAALTKPDDTMNFSKYTGKDINIKELIDLASTVPFFAERRVIIVKDSGFFKSAADDELVEYVKNPSDDTVLIFEESEVDRRSKLFKAIGQSGYASEMKTLDEKTLLSWMNNHFKAALKNISASDLGYMVERIGTDMDLLRNESEKIIAFCGDKDTITRKDIDVVTNKTLSSQIFDMTDAIARKQLYEAMGYYSDLIAMKESPLMILYMITKMFKNLYEVKTYSGADAAQALGLHPFVVKKYTALARSFNTSELLKAMNTGVELESDVKSGRMDEKLSVELFITKLCRSE